MASRRRSRRGWSWPRLHRGLRRRPDALFRATLGGLMVLWAVVLWPGLGPGAPDWRAHTPLPEVTGSPGRLAAAPPSVAVSAKRQLNSEAPPSRDRIGRSSPQVAPAMPEIGVPAPAVPPGIPSAAPRPADGAAAPELPTDAQTAPGAAPPPSAAARDLGPGSTPVGQEAVVAPALSPVAEPGAADGGQSGEVVAILEAPAALQPPRAAAGRMPAWLRHAVASTADSRPAIAVVIDDLGFNRPAAAALNRLKGPLTLAFLPYATGLEEQTRAARAAGHELMVHVPMEPNGRESPGPNPLTSQLEPPELITRLHAQLRSFGGFVGINNHMGSLLTADPEPMAILMAELRRLGLLFLDSRTTPRSVAAREAARLGVPHAERDVFIDNDLHPAAVRHELERAERIARHHGHAVAIGHPHDVTIRALRNWLPTLEAHGIALVPISAIVARRSCTSGILVVAETCARYPVAARAVE